MAERKYMLQFLCEYNKYEKLKTWPFPVLHNFKTNVKQNAFLCINLYRLPRRALAHILMRTKTYFCVRRWEVLCLYWIVSNLKLEWLQPFVLINHFIPIKNYHQLPAYFVLMHLWESWLPKQNGKIFCRSVLKWRV